MEKDWVCIYSTNKEHMAEIARAILEQESIKAIIVNKKDSFYHHGGMEIYINNKDVIKAKYLLRNIENDI